MLFMLKLDNRRYNCMKRKKILSFKALFSNKLNLEILENKYK